MTLTDSHPDDPLYVKVRPDKGKVYAAFRAPNDLSAIQTALQHEMDYGYPWLLLQHEREVYNHEVKQR